MTIQKLKVVAGSDLTPVIKKLESIGFQDHSKVLPGVFDSTGDKFEILLCRGDKVKDLARLFPEAKVEKERDSIIYNLVSQKIAVQVTKKLIRGCTYVQIFDNPFWIKESK